MREKDDKLRLVKRILVDGEDVPVKATSKEQVPSTPRNTYRDNDRVCPATEGRSRQVNEDFLSFVNKMEQLYIQQENSN